MKKKILFTILKLWKSDIWKTDLKIFKFIIRRNFNSSFICILAFMLNFIFDISRRPSIKTKEKGT